ncbi:MAG: GNAT family N-acetyltransferase [Lachnospiraceae bacterium]|nr:GNAT family N-acetyltransferase [Lachnospiraceae bacterium]
MSDIVIDIARAEDWEDAMELAWRTFLKFEAPEYSQEGTDKFLEFISGQELYKMFLCGEYKVLAARDDSKIVGVASLRTGNHISLLFVDEKYHRRGIATRLVAALQREFITGECVQMTVNAAPYAVGFYEKLGFIKTDDFKTADGITYLPMRCMVRIDEQYS